LALLCGAAQADHTRHILHTNDGHSRIEPINGFDSTCSTGQTAAGECFGGRARPATAIAAGRAAGQQGAGAGRRRLIQDRCTGSAPTTLSARAATASPCGAPGSTLTDCVRAGGDGYGMFEGATNAYDSGPGLADVVAACLADSGPYQPFAGVRIKVLRQ